jgi:hypothetical protein
MWWRKTAQRVDRIEIVEVPRDGIVVLRYKDKLSRDQIEHLRNAFKGVLYETNKVIVLEEGLELSILKPAEATDGSL